MSTLRLILLDVFVLAALLGPPAVVHWTIGLERPWALGYALSMTPFTFIAAIGLAAIFVRDDDFL